MKHTQAGFHLAGIVGGVIGFKLHVGHAGLLAGALHAHRLDVEGVARLQHHFDHAVDLVFLHHIHHMLDAAVVGGHDRAIDLQIATGDGAKP